VITIRNWLRSVSRVAQPHSGHPGDASCPKTPQNASPNFGPPPQLIENSWPCNAMIDNSTHPVEIRHPASKPGFLSVFIRVHPRPNCFFCDSAVITIRIWLRSVSLLVPAPGPPTLPVTHLAKKTPKMRHKISTGLRNQLKQRRLQRDDYELHTPDKMRHPGCCQHTAARTHPSAPWFSPLCRNPRSRGATNPGRTAMTATAFSSVLL